MNYEFTHYNILGILGKKFKGWLLSKVLPPPPHPTTHTHTLTHTHTHARARAHTHTHTHAHTHTRARAHTHTHLHFDSGVVHVVKNRIWGLRCTWTQEQCPDKPLIQIVHSVDPLFPQFCNEPHVGPEQSQFVSLPNQDSHVIWAGDEKDHSCLAKSQVPGHFTSLRNKVFKWIERWKKTEYRIL